MIGAAMTQEEWSDHLRERLEILRSVIRDIERISSGKAPTADDLADAPFLDKWTLAASRDVSLIGIVDDHPRLGPGLRTIVTSTVCVIDPSGQWARTESRWYRLGLRIDPRDFLQ
jgi:hypothetical protein